MKLDIERNALLPALQLVSGVVERRQTLPILGNVLVVADGGSLSLTTTDMEVELSVAVEHKALQAGSTTLPARKLLDICRALPEKAKVRIEVDGDKAVVRSGKSRFTLATAAAGDFPSVDKVEGKVHFGIPSGVLRSLIENTQFAMAHQDVRYYLNGLLLDIDGKRLRAVATDGHRLALCETEHSTEIEEPVQVIVPRKGVIELSRILGDTDEEATVILGSNHLQVSLARQRITSKLIDGRFPDYDRVVPKGGTKTVVADRESLKQALTRTSILSNEKFRGIRLTLEDQVLKALAHNPEQEEAEEEVEVEYRGPELQIGFNVSYLVDVLSVIRTEKVELIFTDAQSSCLVKPMDTDNCKYVVMPMRL